MNKLEKLPLTSPLEQDKTRTQALVLFPLESLQNLDPESALRCQILLGHGETFGIWETPEEMIPHMRTHMRRIDLRKRITMSLSEAALTSTALAERLDAGVLWLTRLALLMRMGPAGMGNRARFKPLDASSIIGSLSQPLPKLIARCITRQWESTGNPSTGFASALRAEDQREFQANEFLRAELNRLSQLQAMQLWSDGPAVREFMNKKTSVRGASNPRPLERKRIPFPAIPDEYLAAMGPRVLWVIKDLGPNLIHLLETLPIVLEPGKTASYIIKRRVTNYFRDNTWRDRNGQVIEKPPFNLQHGDYSGKHFSNDPSQHDPFEWPPRNWSSIQNLTAVLQSAHLWIALLVMAARIGEVATLLRDCIEFARDGRNYADGKTYKPSRALAGRDRDWPIPDILVDVFAQQVKLVEASERLARIIKDSVRMGDIVGDGVHLWASLGTSSSADATEKLLTYGSNLQSLARRVGLTPKPGGKNLHPHRFRKTLARLAGLAIDGSQKVLMLLLGHEDVSTTLGYMQTDPAFAKEVDDITRELRIMRGQVLIEDMRASMRDANSLRYGGHGGGGAPVLAEAVRTHENELHRSGEEWDINTARELSVLLTNNGESARLISAYVVCTKVAGEVGLCSGKKGAIKASNCQIECLNHIEDKTGRRDTQRVIPILVQHAQQAIANNDWLPLQRDKRQLEQEIKRYDDICAEWRDKPEVRAIFGANE